MRCFRIKNHVQGCKNTRPPPPSQEPGGSTLPGSHSFTCPLSPLCEVVCRPQVWRWVPSSGSPCGFSLLLVMCSLGAQHL